MKLNFPTYLVFAFINIKVLLINLYSYALILKTVGKLPRCIVRPNPKAYWKQKLTKSTTVSITKRGLVEH